MANRFYFGDDSVPAAHSPGQSHRSSSDSDLDTTTLPFPKPLSRPSFLTSEFDPHIFLAGLSTSNRFQTLEDLQSELRELSSSINRELVDLVNENYEAFVSLGNDLRGGDEKVEEVRVGLLGFEKDVTGLKEKVVLRRAEVEELVKQKREVRREIGIGRGLLEVNERLEDLELRLGMREGQKEVTSESEMGLEGAKWSDEWDEDSMGESDEEYKEDDEGVPGRVKVLTEKYLITKLLVKRHDPAHPFLVAQKERMQRVQDKVRLELETAIRSADQVRVKQRLIQMRVQMDE